MKMEIEKRKMGMRRQVEMRKVEMEMRQVGIGVAGLKIGMMWEGVTEKGIEAGRIEGTVGLSFVVAVRQGGRCDSALRLVVVVGPSHKVGPNCTWRPIMKIGRAHV